MLEAWQEKGRMYATSEARKSNNTMWIAWTGFSGQTAQTFRSQKEPLLNQPPKTLQPCGKKSQGLKWNVPIHDFTFGKEFFKGISCLWRCLCMKKSKDQKLEESVTQTLKLLKYPFSLSKSSLGAPGASTTWPHIRAALVWIIKIICMLQVGVQVEACMLECMSPDDQVPSCFFHANWTIHMYGQNRALSREQLESSDGGTSSSEMASTNKYLGDMYRAFMNMDDDLQNNLEALREEDYKNQMQKQVTRFETFDEVSLCAWMNRNCGCTSGSQRSCYFYIIHGVVSQWLNWFIWLH